MQRERCIPDQDDRIQLNPNQWVSAAEKKQADSFKALAFLKKWLRGFKILKSTSVWKSSYYSIIGRVPVFLDIFQIAAIQPKYMDIKDGFRVKSRIP